jgi:hypothetical protein
MACRASGETAWRNQPVPYERVPCTDRYPRSLPPNPPSRSQSRVGSAALGTTPGTSCSPLATISMLMDVARWPGSSNLRLADGTTAA